MYFASVEASMELAKKEGPYSSYEGSPMSKGIMQPDMWDVTPGGRWDWAGLRAKVAEHGIRNSLLMAPMPTASTAQIMGNNESTEPFTSNTRRLYILDVNGSVDSLLPIICAVEAVGIGAINNELRIPCSATLARNPAQSQRPPGVTSHISGCIIPLDIGEPSYDEYGPSFLAKSIEASTDAKYIVSNISLLSCKASGESNAILNLANASARP
jgi:hypothetical protein